MSLNTIMARTARRIGWDDLDLGFEALGLSVLADYDGKYKVRVNASGLACAWDDRRAATDVGRASFPANSGTGVSCGANYTGLTGVSKATIGIRAIPFITNANQWVVGRWGTSANSNQQWAVEITSSGKWQVQLNDPNGGAGITYTWTGANSLAGPAGTLYDAYVLIDLTQATDLAKISVVYAPFDPVAETYGVFVTDAGGSATAGFPATIPSLAPTTQPVLIGKRGAGSSGFNGFIDDIKVWPGAVLTNAQMLAARSDNQAVPNWVAPDLWFPFTDFLNHGAAGHTFDGTVTGDVMLCTDDPTVGCTLLSGSTNAPNYDAVNGIVSGDGVSKYMRAVGGQITRIGATEDFALVMIGQEPVGSTVRWVTVTDLAVVINLLAAQAMSGSDIEALANNRLALIAEAAGIRVVVVRRRQAATDVAIKDGTAAEQLGTSGAVTSGPPADVSIFANPAGALPSNGTLRRLLVVKGNIDGLQALPAQWGKNFAGATI